MESKDLAFSLALVLAEKQALEIIIIDVDDKVSYTSQLVLASGRNERHVRALADQIADFARAELGRRPLGSEGLEKGTWSLLDFGDVVVHLFREQERLFYDLEGMWEDAQRIRVDTAPPQREAATGS